MMGKRGTPYMPKIVFHVGLVMRIGRKYTRCCYHPSEDSRGLSYQPLSTSCLRCQKSCESCYVEIVVVCTEQLVDICFGSVMPTARLEKEDTFKQRTLFHCAKGTALVLPCSSGAVFPSAGHAYGMAQYKSEGESEVEQQRTMYDQVFVGNQSLHDSWLEMLVRELAVRLESFRCCAS